MTDDGRRACPKCGALHFGADDAPCPACLVRLGLIQDSTTVGTTSVEAVPADSPDRPMPARIGDWRPVRLLGEGGMGVVYLADDLGPMNRQAALKQIKHGLDSRRVLDRFDQERRVLARMDHPGIARAIDAGTADDGTPYFVMEFVDGVPITEYCDRHRLTFRERLRIFARLCDAVEHAHRRGILHRDLKPSNILVVDSDEGPQPKVIDFGVARAIARQRLEWSVFTEFGRLVGTPEYMSPEQADLDNDDLDTRSDVYGLGVVLYELLVGKTPHDPRSLRELGLEALLRTIRQGTFPTPSSRLSTLGDEADAIAQLRSSDAGRLRRGIVGELDWIVMRATARDRERRYGSPHELGEDIQRYLDHLPIVAGPPGLGYRARKFVKRHRIGVAVAAAVVTALLVGTAGLAVGLRRALASEKAANQARADLETVVEFQAGMLAGVDAAAMGRRLLTDLRDREALALQARGGAEAQVAATAELFNGVNATDAALRVIDEEILARALTSLDERFADRPAIDGRLRLTIGTTYQRLGMNEKAEPALRSAAEIQRRELGAEHANTLLAMNNLAVVYWATGRYEEAEALELETIEIKKRALGEEHPSTLKSMHNLANTYKTQGRLAEAERLYLELIETRGRVLGEAHEATLSSMNNLAIVYHDEGRYEQAEELATRALEGYRAALGDDHPHTLLSAITLGRLYKTLGRYDEAEPLYLEAFETQKATLGEDHPDTLVSMSNLANLYLVQGRIAEAERTFLDAIDVHERVFGRQHPSTLICLDGLAALYNTIRQYDKAEALFVETLRARERVLGYEHRKTLTSRSNLAELYVNTQRFEAAEVLHLEVFETRRRLLGDEDPDTVESLNGLAVLYANQGRAPEAIDLFRQTIAHQKRLLGDDHPTTLLSLFHLALVYQGHGRADLAVDYFVETVEGQRRTYGEDHPRTLTTQNDLGLAYQGLGRYDEAEAIYVDTLDKRRRTLGETHPQTLDSLYNMACLDAVRGNRDEAMDWLRKAVEGGFSDIDWMVQDSDLSSLHGPEFDALAEAARQR